MKFNYSKLFLVSLLLGLLSFMQSSSTAINTNVKWSELQKVPKHKEPKVYVLANGSFVHCWRHKDKLFFKQYDQHMNLKKEAEYSFSHELAEGRLMLPTLIQLGDDLLIFTELKDGEEHVFHHFYMKMSLMRLKTLIPHTFFKDIPFMGRYEYEHLLWNVSPDHQRLLLTYNNPNPNVELQDNLDNYIELLDNKLKTIGKVKNFTINDERIRLYNAFYSNSSLINSIKWAKENECILAYTAPSLMKTNIASITTIKFNLEQKSRSKNTYQIGDFNIISSNFCLNQNDEIIMTGYYSNSGEKGVFSIKEDIEKRQFFKPQLKVIPHEQMNYITEEANTSFGELLIDFPNNSLKIFTDNGYTYMIGEHLDIEREVKYYQDSKGNDRTRVKFLYLEKTITVTKFNTEGTLEWFTQIPKCQVSKKYGSARLSFKYNFDGNNLYFIYLDNEKNFTKLNPTNLERSNVNRNLVLLGAKINSNGQLKREVIAKESKSEGMFTSRNNYKQFKSGFIIERVINKEWGFGQVQL